MSYTNVYPSRINWENEPSIASPINATNLNKIDYAVYEHDQTFETWDVTKANQSDLLLSVKEINYDNETGVFVFTWQNGTTKTIDLNIEKIPVLFSMSPQGVITMTTEDGTQYTADVGALIKTYTFTDSTEIDFTVTTDQSGNKTITAAIKDGSIVGTKLEPNYLANCQSAANSASASKTAAEGSAEDSEAWAVGTRDGVPVQSTDPAYENNAKYWAQHTSASLAGLTDTDITSPTNGQVLTYDGTKWINDDPSAGGGSTIKVTTSESALYGRTVTIACGTYTESGTFSNSGEVEFTGVTATGNFTITSSTSGGDTATATLDVPYFGNYTKQLTLFNATVTITFPYSNGASCTLSDGVTSLTANTSPMAFNVPNVGTWVATCTLDGVSKTQSFTITTDGQTETHTFEYGTINLTYDNEFRGLTITCTKNTSVITKTAPSTGNTMVFYPDATGEWIIASTYSGTPYSTNATVSSLSTPVSAILQTIPNGSTTTPTDVVQTWLKCATINDKSYTTLNEVLADTDTFTALLQDSNACDYMARSTTWSTDICADADAMARVGKYDYCSCALLGNSTWASAIVASAYVDSVLNGRGLVPILSSGTGSNGVVNECGYTYRSYDATYGQAAWCAFDGNASRYAALQTGSTTAYIGYTFNDATKVSVLYYDVTTLGTLTVTYKITLQYSDDNSTWNDGSSEVTLSGSTNKAYIISTETATHRYWRIKRATSESQSTVVGELQFYGSHTAQTNIIHSAASDTLYYIDGTNQTIGTTDTSGVGTVNWSNVPVGNLTIYSSVANDPDDLTSAYSKTVRITPHTVEVYVMPDNALYWYGYQSSNCESMTSANGWSLSGYTFDSATFNTQNVTLLAAAWSSTGHRCGIASKTEVSANKMISIAQGVTELSGYGYGSIRTTTSKASADQGVNVQNITSSSVAKVEKSFTQGNYYICATCDGGSTPQSSKVYALWYE